MGALYTLCDRRQSLPQRFSGRGTANPTRDFILLDSKILHRAVVTSTLWCGEPLGTAPKLDGLTTFRRFVLRVGDSRMKALGFDPNRLADEAVAGKERILGADAFLSWSSNLDSPSDGLRLPGIDGGQQESSR